jgi:sRNA-binding carbon storage regulator CsrA
MNTKLSIDLVRHQLGWDYVEMNLPNGEQILITVKSRSNNYVSLTFNAPREVKIRGYKLTKSNNDAIQSTELANIQ